MEMSFCRRCGKPLNETGEYTYACTTGHVIYQNPLPGAGVFFVSPDNTQVLLSTRGIEPRIGMLDAFGGFLKIGESMEQGAVRELHEELGLTTDDYEALHYLVSGSDDYPYKGETFYYAAVLFWTRLKEGVALHPADDSASADWYPLAILQPERLQSDDVRKGIRALQEIFK